MIHTFGSPRGDPSLDNCRQLGALQPIASGGDGDEDEVLLAWEVAPPPPLLSPPPPPPLPRPPPLPLPRFFFPPHRSEARGDTDAEVEVEAAARDGMLGPAPRVGNVGGRRCHSAWPSLGRPLANVPYGLDNIAVPPAVQGPSLHTLIT
jgi:hypothetical protein